MYTIDTTSLSHFLSTLAILVQGALHLDPAAFQAVQHNSRALPVTLLILFLAGISQTIGQSVVLFINRVKPLRFLASLVVSGAIFVSSIVIWIATTWLFGTFVFQRNVSMLDVIAVICLAYAPLFFGIFILLPYLGTFIDHALDIWCLLAVLTAMNATLRLSFAQALFSTLFGWLIFVLLKFTIGRPIVYVTKFFRSFIAGVPFTFNVQEMIKNVAQKNANDSK